MRKPCKPMEPTEILETIKLYNGGLPQKHIARKLGRDDTTIGDQLRKHGFKTPGRLRGEKNQFHRGGVFSQEGYSTKVSDAVKKGIIECRKNCESCGQAKTYRNGKAGVHAHHDDYNKPLEVRWLCRKCHFAWHSKNTAVPRTPAGSEGKDDAKK